MTSGLHGCAIEDCLVRENTCERTRMLKNRGHVAEQSLAVVKARQQPSIVERKDIIPPEDFAEWELEQRAEVQRKTPQRDCKIFD